MAAWPRCSSRTQEATWLHCPVLCVWGTHQPPSLAPPHTKTHAWSPPPPLLPLLVRGEREAESSEERTLVELYKVRVNTDRWRFHAGFVFSLPFSITYPAILPEAVCSRQLLSPVQVMTSRHPQPIKSLGTHGQKGHVYSPPWHPFNKTTFFTKNCLYFTFQFLFCCRTPCNAMQDRLYIDDYN